MSRALAVGWIDRAIDRRADRVVAFDNRRDKQRADPGDWWRVWLLHPGRRWGKGYAASHWIADRVASGVARSIALVGSTNTHVRQLMIEHPESGLLVTSPGAKFFPGKLEVHWPSGAIAYVCSAENADKPPLRGGGFDTGWADECDSWGQDTTNAKATKAWDNLSLSMSAGDSRLVVTSTPKPGRIVAELLLRAKKDGDVAVTTGSTYENAENLSPEFIAAIERRYKGTHLEEQEIHGKVLSEIHGALWTLESFRYRSIERPCLRRVVVGVDPSGGAEMIGIVAAGEMADRDGWIVLDDWTEHYTPAGWAKRSVELMEEWGADAIIAERNYGGDMVESTIYNHDKTAPVKVVTASRGKHIRAEPISLLYEKGLVWHRRDAELDLLEDEMKHMTQTGYIGEHSPNRLDACVWAMTELAGGDLGDFDLLYTSTDPDAAEARVKALKEKIGIA